MATNKPMLDEKKIIWWKDTKLLIGCLLLIISFVIGALGKGIFIVKFYEPVYRYTGLSMWALSWVITLIGIFLLGIETIKMIKQHIQNQVKKTVRKTYHYTKRLPKKAIHYTKRLIKH